MEQIARSRWNVGPLAVIVLTVTWSCGGSVPEQSRADSAGVSTTARLSGAKVAVEPSLATRFCRDSIVQGNDAAEPCVGSVGRHDIARESEAKQFWQFAGLAGVFENATDTVSRCAERTKARCEALGSQSQTLAQITIRPVKDAIKIVPDHLEQRVIVAPRPRDGR
ncbi:MAG: hypothetical protein IPP20_10730 [Gemmatimonadetes bacterium]|nr:hypothetical protein [Gemmatimonadota bacterium]